MRRILVVILASLILSPGRSQTGEYRRISWIAHSTDARSAVFSPDGKRLLTAGGDKRVKLWDIASGKIIHSWKLDSDEVGAALFTPDGKKAIAGGEEYALRIWDTETGDVLGTLVSDVDGTRNIALSPDGKTAATASFDGALKLWDIETLKELATLQKGEGAKTMCLAFSPDGERLLAGEFDYYTRLYDVKRLRPIAAWEGHDNPVVTSVAFSPDASRMLTGGRDNTLRLWDALTRRQLSLWRGHASHVLTLAYSPDGKTVLSGSADYTIKKWNAQTGRLLDTWHGHTGAVRSVAFSPDGKTAVSASDDKTVRFWNVSGPQADSTGKTARRPPMITLPAGAGSPRERLGRMLFFDPRLSGDGTLHCASCHMPEEFYADDKPLSFGYSDTPYFRNTPSLLNASRQKNLYWDGRMAGGDMPTLVRDHISESYFMNADGRMIVERLRQAPGYLKAFDKVYGREPAYGDVLDALTEFLKTLRSSENAYDRWKEGDRFALSPQAERGRELFFGKGGCAKCHSGPLFSDDKFHARPVADNPAIFQDLMRHVTFRHFFRVAGVEGYVDLKKDVGLYAVTKNPEDKFKFKTPTLLEVARTAPYMHNGSIGTLEEAVAMENSKLSEEESRDLVAFLKSLSSEVPIVEPPPLPEYALLAPASPKTAQAPLPEASDEKIPESFPPLAPLPPVPIPEDNPQTPEKSKLGEILFCEPLLTGNGDNYCSHCHMPYTGWGDSSDVSQGHKGTLHWRNSQTLFNAAYFSRLNWDGSALSLEDQARSAMLSGVSGNADPALIEERLALLPEYVDLFKRVFGTERPQFEGVVKALAAFQRDVPISRNVPFDNYLRGQKNAISPAAVRGRALFEGKAGCIRCHNGPLLSDQGFHATGVPTNPAFKNVPMRQIALRYEHIIHGVPEKAYREANSDPGLYLSTLKESDRGKFRTQSLRELKHTAPYMHNGVFPTLRDVVNFYDAGGGKTPNKSPRLKPLNLSADEKSDLLAFLESLSMDKVDPLRIKMR